MIFIYIPFVYTLTNIKSLLLSTYFKKYVFKKPPCFKCNLFQSYPSKLFEKFKCINVTNVIFIINRTVYHLYKKIDIYFISKKTSFRELVYSINVKPIFFYLFNNNQQKT